MSSAPGLQTGVPSTDVLRSIAHELRQPLSTIESIAYYLSLVSPRDDEKVQEQLLRLQQLVEQSNWILTSGLQLADPATAAPQAIDISDLIAQVTSARPPLMEYPPRLELAEDLPKVKLDPGLGRALIENLLTLFRQLAVPAHPVLVRTSAAPQTGVWLEIETGVPGYRSEAALGAGASLSLASARRTVEAHGGAMEVTVSAESGIYLCVVLP
jgi:two-component system, OmpR family, sensor kinase